MKINVYVPDALYGRMRTTMSGANISAICQAAITEELERLEAIEPDRYRVAKGETNAEHAERCRRGLERQADADPADARAAWRAYLERTPAPVGSPWHPDAPGMRDLRNPHATRARELLEVLDENWRGRPPGVQWPVDAMAAMAAAHASLALLDDRRSS